MAHLGGAHAGGKVDPTLQAFNFGVKVARRTIEKVGTDSQRGNVDAALGSPLTNHFRAD